MSECKYERELTAAAELLQTSIPAGKMKAIGLLEVTAGIEQLIAERDAALAERDAARAELKLAGACTSANDKLAERVRELLPTIREPFDEGWRIKGMGEHRIKHLANSVRMLAEAADESCRSTDEAYNALLALSTPLTPDTEAT